MDDEVRYIDSPHISNPGTPRNDDIAVVSSTSNYTVAQGHNTGKESSHRKNVTRTIAEYKTKYHADVVEWCPYTTYNDHLACGTYELQEDGSGVWLGCILLCQLNEETLEIKKEIDVRSGVFDLKWRPDIQESGNLVVAYADGHLEMIDVLPEDCDNTTEVQSLNITTDKQKPLSIDWNYLFDTSKSDHLVVSDSSGNLHYLNVQFGLHVDRVWKAHLYEAWNAIFDHHDLNIIYSGGDDNKLKGWDLRTNLQTPTLHIKDHTMGVTCMAKSNNSKHLLASGSYDELIYLWDLRQLQNPLSRLHIDGGGIWKLKWHPKSNDLLVAAMHAGFYIVQLKDSKLNINTSYTKHSSLAYGVDWKKGTSANIVASCSFYNNLLHVWEA